MSNINFYELMSIKLKDTFKYVFGRPDPVECRREDIFLKANVLLY